MSRSRKLDRSRRIDEAFEGRYFVVDLIMNGVDWRVIRTHPDAQRYLSYHKQAKMLRIRHLVENKAEYEEIVDILNTKIT
jgi:hypothetical protein